MWDKKLKTNRGSMQGRGQEAARKRGRGQEMKSHIGLAMERVGRSIV